MWYKEFRLSRTAFFKSLRSDQKYLVLLQRNIGSGSMSSMVPPSKSRNEQFQDLIRSRISAKPYDNIRPINVPARFDGQTLYECLISMHPHVGQEQWQQWFQLGHILDGDRPVPMETVVRGGNQFQHLFPNWVEPEVNVEIEILCEDESIIAVSKPAPLPVHPSGRFNRNTLVSLLGTVYSTADLRVVHRLDANTTGVIIFARTAAVATVLRDQFETNQVKKTYLVRCAGHPDKEEFCCNEPISRERGPSGLRSVDSNGNQAMTAFQLLRCLDDGTAILRAMPTTGRTHQIRIHLWALGYPIVGDPSYLPNGETAATQTLGICDPPMCLHADQLQFHHPATRQPITIPSSKPDWFVNL